MLDFMESQEHLRHQNRFLRKVKREQKRRIREKRKEKRILKDINRRQGYGG